jgi:hypothetical protein
MKEAGLSVDKMESLYVSNLLVFYKSGNYKKEDVRKLSSSDGYNRKFIVTDVGIGFKTYKEGKIKGVTIYPYSMIKSIFVTTTSIEMSLID